jgi:PAS domain S-box-containing protein
MPDNGFQILWEDGERVLSRGWQSDNNGGRRSVLIALPAAGHLSRSSLDRLTHEYELRDQLDPTWAVRPLDLKHDEGRTLLVLEDVGGEPLHQRINAAMDVGSFLRLAVAIAAAVDKLHERGLVHKDIKPAKILLDPATGKVWLTGFGIASRLARERQQPKPPEMIVGTFAYMAPEQTGRMNRSVDSRSDLYALGVTFYQLLTGALPFTATDPMEWIHCHLAKRPMAPAERLPETPAVVSALIMKLLAKRAEDRYQTATGLESDLRRCEIQWRAGRRVDDFPLGEHDTPHRLLIPEKLYGRQDEVASLLAAFERVVQGCRPELVLVSGYSGIGKSSLVNELQPVLVPPRGLFASGKFDQYRRDVPYATVAQAFQSLVRPLLAKSDAELCDWRAALLETLGQNAQLMVHLVPELHLLLGEQGPASELPPQEAQRRFQLVLRRFLAVFATPEHPLALFLDDLQWLDADTLDLLEDLLIHPDVRHLLLIGAYRDNEVNATHPLVRKLELLRATGRVHDIQLAPLTAADLGALLADSLRSDAQQVAPLAGLVHAKTAGNPFFVIQFLQVLADEGLLAFDHKHGRWSFDLGGIHAKQYTDNVVDLLVGRLARLPPDTQGALRQLACLGNVAAVGMLSIVLKAPEEQVDAALWEGVRQQLVERIDRSYKFVHDRVHEAAYALIPAESRAAAHLAIGRSLAVHTPREDATIFEVVNQLNRGAALITSQEDREQLAELNLAAGKRAKASSAFAAARTYLTAGTALLSETTWERRQELAFDLQLHCADCDVFFGALQVAEQRLATLATRPADTIQRCAVARRRVDLYSMLGNSDQAIAVGLEGLGQVGIHHPAGPAKVQGLAEFERVWTKLANGAIENLVDLPLMHDPAAAATLELLAAMAIPAHYSNESLHEFVVSRAVELCLDRGNGEAAPVSYAAMALIAVASFGRYEEGYRLGKTACALIERRGLKHFGTGRTYYYLATLIPWHRSMRESIDPVRRAFQIGKDQGHPTFATLAGRTVISILLASGHPLEQLEREAEQIADFTQPFGFFLDRISAPLALVRTLCGRTPKFGSLNDGRLAEASFEQRLTGLPTYAFLEGYYWLRKLQARFFACDYASAAEAADHAERCYEASVAMPKYLTELAEFHFFAALTRAARCELSAPDSHATHKEALRRHRQKFQGWAANCPQNFADRAALIVAEIARVEGRPLDAMDHYERAIAAARSNGFVHNEAIAHELAARFHAARGFATIANAYLREARSCYLRWGADGKVRQLEALHPFLREPQSTHAAAETIAVPLEQLDFATVVKVSQAVSGEMVLEKLVDALMRLGVEHAGAERALLLLSRGNELWQEAEATTSADGINIRRQEVAAALPDSIIHYVIRSREIILLEDAAAHPTYSQDSYVRGRNARSILCLPLVVEAKATGVLYLENNLAPHVFTPDRVTVLKVLASQAAIALENSYLYRDLAESEQSLRSAIDGIPGLVAILTPTGDVEAINRQIVQYGGLSLEKLKGRGASGTIHHEDLAHVAAVFTEAIASGVPYEIEARLRRFDGEYRRFDIRGIPVRDTSGRIARWYVLLTDIEDRTQALTKLQQMQSDFAHINRVSTMGELAASLAHEILHPIATARNNARAGMRFLEMSPPKLTDAREALGCVVRDADRARDIVGRVRDHIKKAPPRRECFDLNEAVREALFMVRSSIAGKKVAVDTHLGQERLTVLGDRVQLQQVVVNLILNAVEAMSADEKGLKELSIRVVADQADGGVLVQVGDSGPGIDPSNAERVFEPFYTTKATGVGMGLSICRSIINGHGGRLWVAPNEPRGAVFQFTLPPHL